MICVQGFAELIVMIIGMRLRFHLKIRRSKLLLLLHVTVIASGDFL